MSYSKIGSINASPKFSENHFITPPFIKKILSCKSFKPLRFTTILNRSYNNRYIPNNKTSLQTIKKKFNFFPSSISCSRTHLYIERQPMLLNFLSPKCDLKRGRFHCLYVFYFFFNIRKFLFTIPQRKSYYICFRMSFKCLQYIFCAIRHQNLIIITN